MKISILTATYNRANLLLKLYESILKNLREDINVEWLIMDDGSTDNTQEIIKKIITENRIEIKCFFQENQGKMKAVNNLVDNATGDLIIDCDSDDYFSDNAFQTIKEEYEKNKSIRDIYGLCFLKYDQNGKNMGNKFKNQITTMFDLYFKEGETGEKAIVFYSNIRKQYKHKLENNERFVTEARMYHEIDKKYKIICINRPIMICQYQKEGYTNNIIKQFIENPYGYYEYFKEILQRNTKEIDFTKRLYAIKHYILFMYLTKNKKSGKYIKTNQDRMLYYILLFPGIIKSKVLIKKYLKRK